MSSSSRFEPGSVSWKLVAALLAGAIGFLAYANLQRALATVPAQRSKRDVERVEERELPSAPSRGSALVPRGSPSEAASPGASPIEQASDVAEEPLPDGTIWIGRLLDAGGAPIKDPMARISLQAGDTPIADTRPQRDGHFSFAGLPAGSYRVRATAKDHLELDEALEIGASPARLERDLVLQQAWKLAVKILTPDGQPLHAVIAAHISERPQLRSAEVHAIATAWQPSGDFPPTASRELNYGLGIWRSSTSREAQIRGNVLGSQFAGAFELEAREPLWISAVLRHRILAMERVAPGTPELTLTVPIETLWQSLSTLRLRVIDAATRAPVPGARVAISTRSSGNSGRAVEADGRIELRDLFPGHMELHVWSNDARIAPVDVQLEPGAVLDLGDLAIEAPRLVKGRCRPLPADPRAINLSVLCLDPPPHPALIRTFDRVQAAADGTFTLHLLEGRHFVRAFRGGGAAREIDTRALDEDELVLELAPEAQFRIQGTSRGEPYQLRIEDAAGHRIMRSWIPPNARYPIDCLPGTYRVEIVDRHGKVTAQEIGLGFEGYDLRVPE
ncbi:MAG: carboxypeptidase regulatory-like domain-containing protein [Planctomycetes bacterium]|nr:carboxypeptidase regulatory-like domain-containing protein [Planctomycetota bacterium]